MKMCVQGGTMKNVSITEHFSPPPPAIIVDNSLRRRQSQKAAQSVNAPHPPYYQQLHNYKGTHFSLTCWNPFLSVCDK